MQYDVNKSGKTSGELVQKNGGTIEVAGNFVRNSIQSALAQLQKNKIKRKKKPSR